MTTLPVPYQPRPIGPTSPEFWLDASDEQKANFVAFLTILPRGMPIKATPEQEYEAAMLMLAGRPAWALDEAKKLIANGRAGFEHRFQPSIPECGQLLDRIMEPHVHARQRAEQSKRRFHWDEDDPTERQKYMRGLGSKSCGGNPAVRIVLPMMPLAEVDPPPAVWTPSDTYRRLMEQGVHRRPIVKHETFNSDDATVRARLLTGVNPSDAFERPAESHVAR